MPPHPRGFPGPQPEIVTQFCFIFFIAPHPSLLEIILYSSTVYLILVCMLLIPRTPNVNLLFIHTISIYVLISVLGAWYLAVNRKTKITTHMELTFL